MTAINITDENPTLITIQDTVRAGYPSLAGNFTATFMLLFQWEFFRFGVSQDATMNGGEEVSICRCLNSSWSVATYVADLLSCLFWGDRPENYPFRNRLCSKMSSYCELFN